MTGIPAVDRLSELNALTEDSSLWDNPTNAQKLMRERTKLEQGINGCTAMIGELTDNVELIEMGEMDDDQELVEEAENALTKLAQRSKELELQSLLSGEVDGNDCYVEIHAGAGGTESQDWASMLLRMYMRWGESRGYKVSSVQYMNGEEAGIKSATIEIKGENAFGWAKTEERSASFGAYLTV